MAATGLRSVFRDPLFRCEKRRYWNRRRYAAWLAFLVAWAGALTVLAGVELGPFGGARWRTGFDELQNLALMFYCYALPLNFLAATAGALSIAPERDSGQLEQMVLTPVEPDRFCRTRWAGRLYGVMVLYGLYLPVLALCGWLLLRRAVHWDLGPWQKALIAGVLYLMLGAVLMINTAVGMRFSATSRTAAAMARTYPAALLLVPASMFWGIFAISVLIAGCVAAATMRVLGPAAGIGVAVLVPAWFAVHSVRRGLDDASRAMEKVFYAPGEA